MNSRWKQRPSGSTWGDFGPDDQLGRLNLLTPEKVRQGVAEVREGRVFCLSLPLDFPGGNKLNVRRHAPRLAPTFRDGKPYVNFPLGKLDPQASDVISDDQATLWLQYSTQWDSLAHVGAWFDADGDGVPEVRYYNGYRGGVEIGADTPAPERAAIDPYAGARALGIERIAESALQGRGVLVDLARAYGDARRTVGYDDLMRAMEAQCAAVEPGDILCLRTGQADVLLEAGPDPDPRWLDGAFCHLDGCDDKLLRWIADCGVAAIAADNYAVEAVPPTRSDDGLAYERLHELCLFKLGIPLGELWYFGELARWLARHARTRFLLTAPPLRLPGAAGAPVTPVATV